MISYINCKTLKWCAITVMLTVIEVMIFCFQFYQHHPHHHKLSSIFSSIKLQFLMLNTRIILWWKICFQINNQKINNNNNTQLQRNLQGFLAKILWLSRIPVPEYILSILYNVAPSHTMDSHDNDFKLQRQYHNYNIVDIWARTHTHTNME